MSKLFFLPLSCFILFQFTFIGTYIAAVIQGHVVPDVPYISDAATYSPESCVFGQLISIGVILLGLTIYTRYRQLQDLCGRFPGLEERIGKINRLSLWVGLASCFGISIVGNFQETNVRIMHYVGAFLCFGFGTIYFWFQSFMSILLQPFINIPRFIARARFALCFLCTIFFFEVAITGVISHLLFEGIDPRKWYPSDGGWRYHVASSIGEWIVATIFCFYIVTFTEDFKYLGFDHPTMRILEFDEYAEEQIVASSPISPSPEGDENLIGSEHSMIAQEV